MNKQQKKWEERLLAMMRKPGYRPLKQHELIAALNLRTSVRNSFRRVLYQLESDGMIAKLQKNRWGMPETSGEKTGKISVTPQGFGFVTFEESTDEDVFIPRQDINSARNGDQVVIRTSGIAAPGRPGPEGRVVRILKRGQSVATGTLFHRRDEWFIVPDDTRMPAKITIYDTAEGVEPRRDWKGVVELGDETDPLAKPSGILIEMLGKADDPEVEILALMRGFGFDQEFPAAVTEASKGLKVDTSKATLSKRLDLRKELTVTIDPLDARDFDDALSIGKLDNGHWQLGIHIADVSHYVPQGGVIDEEAVRRATSCYLVDRVVTMLPENLTNRICSLVPHEDRLTHSVLVEMDNTGKVHNFDTAETVIHSDKRFTYEEVQDFFDTGECDLEGVNARIKRGLNTFRKLAGKLRAERMEGGAINFNIPEIRCQLDKDGAVKEILKREPKEANQLVEEFMLLGNRLVGTLLSSKDIPSLYRIHEEPSEQQWGQMAIDLAAIGIDASPQGRGDLAAIAEEAMQREARLPIFVAVLKNLKRAEYSSEVIGHFGLAFDQYSHFTSPIRRYPDLIVHRILKAFEQERKTPYTKDELSELAGHCSELERNAEKAEKESVKIKLIRHYADELREGNIGPYAGYVTSIIPKGMIVEIGESFTRGLLPFKEMGGEYYEIDRDGNRARGKRSGHVWAIGDPIDVDLLKVDILAKQIEFMLAAETTIQPKKSAAKKGRGKSSKKKSKTGSKSSRSSSRGKKRKSNRTS